jgi:hypothetical protein
MVRNSNWQSALSAYIEANARRPFRYGEFDCGLFVAGAIEAMTGVDVAAELRGYRDRAEAFERIRSACGRARMDSVADYLALKFGIAAIGVNFAGRGDAVQFANGRLGIVALHGTEVLTPYKDGLLRLPIAQAVRAWRI